MRKLREFRGINADVWQKFLARRAENTYRLGNILFYQGNRPLGLFFICRGRVKLVKEDRFGHSRIVRVVEAPDILGDRAFFAERPYACSGEAMDETRACFLERRVFCELFGQNLPMFHRLTQRFAQELGSAEHAMHCLSACPVNARVATHLLMYPKQRGSNAPLRGELTLQESRTELAQILGTTIEAVSRALALFASRRWIAVEGRHVRILEEDRLRRAACPHLPLEP
ncbi:MAG: Crp/Fnr family transcriptional regulator [Elusimicrobia bacterium]|nr:Crp/Fnr family transcriptional regulator [Elusimicrobiota bacterium]